MFRTKTNGSRGAMPASFRRFLPVLLTAALLIPIQSVDAAAPTTSGTIQLGNTLIYGTTAYAMDYNYSSQAQVGSNLSITITLHIGALTGLVEYISHYQIIVDVNLPGTRVLNSSIIGGNNSAFPIPKYPGSVWGPNTVHIPLTADNTGLAKGQTANATVSVILQDLVWYGGQLGIFDSEPPMQGSAGSVTISNGATTSTGSSTGQTGGQTQAYLPYALLASGAVLMLSAVFLPRGPRPSQATK